MSPNYRGHPLQGRPSLALGPTNFSRASGQWEVHARLRLRTIQPLTAGLQQALGGSLPPRFIFVIQTRKICVSICLIEIRPAQQVGTLLLPKQSQFVVLIHDYTLHAGVADLKPHQPTSALKFMSPLLQRYTHAKRRQSELLFFRGLVRFVLTHQLYPLVLLLHTPLAFPFFRWAHTETPDPGRNLENIREIEQYL